MIPRYLAAALPSRPSELSASIVKVKLENRMGGSPANTTDVGFGHSVGGREEEDDAGIDFTVIGFGSEEDRDNLQQIDGIGRFVEKKLNGIGIYKISQIASMTQEISEEVNQAIGLGPGRIDRDEWVLQAKRLIR